jgi:tRNA-modifying protein YgfZ
MVATICDRGVVRVSGDAAADYLQGQVSQDVDAIAVGSSAWSLVLQPTGKLVAWFRIHRIADDEFLLDVEPAAVDGLVERLERFTLRTPVEFVVEPGWRLLSVRGEPAPAVDGLAAEFSWPGFEGVDVLAPDLVAPANLDLDPDRFEEARIRAGVPRLGTDIDEDTIPAEGGPPFVEGSVSFTKGCYTGQELFARIDSRGGNVPRPLRVLEAQMPLSAGHTVSWDGADVGRTSSAQGVVALARILRKVTPGTAVDVEGVRATVL